ncbi:hypothetical protein BD408DRAFT_417199, partial [Parasitella parasitica]
MLSTVDLGKPNSLAAAETLMSPSLIVKSIILSRVSNEIFLFFLLILLLVVLLLAAVLFCLFEFMFKFVRNVLEG